MVTPRMGMKGMTSTAPIRGWLPFCSSMSMSSTALAAPARAAARTAAGEPIRVASSRLWSGSDWRLSNVVPATDVIAATMASITSTRRPSLKLGTTSTSGSATAPGPLIGVIVRSGG